MVSVIAFSVLCMCSFQLAASTITGQQILSGSSFPSLGTCSLLNFHLPGRVFFPNNAEYHDELKAYWSLTQGDLHPSCRFTPWSSSDLQQAMFVISHSEASFAIKSGGHSVVANTSNIEEGLVIDLALLNHVTLSSNEGVIDIGAGARWTEVYKKLRGTGSGVVGARSGSVGVGGYLVGGGLSIHNGEAGWACDNIDMFEVILGNGTLLEVDYERHPDLFMALKGGGSNFGIISRVQLKLLPEREAMDVMFVRYEHKELPAVFAALQEYNTHSIQNANTSVSISVGGQLDQSLPSIIAIFSHPSDTLTSVPLAPFLSIKHHITTHKKTSQLDLSELYDEMNPPHYRQHRTTTTIQNDATTITQLTNDYLSNIYRNVSLISSNTTQNHTDQSGLLIQPLTKTHLTHSTSTSPNMLGLNWPTNSSTPPLILISTEVRHLNSSNDAEIEFILSSFIQRTEKTARQNNAAHDFKYLNYADPFHDVFAHARSHDELWTKVLEVKQQYDPENVFGRQMRHPFKIQYIPEDWCGTGPRSLDNAPDQLHISS